MTSCIFCKIAEGSVSAKIVYQDSHVVAFRDLNPQAPVHILVIPKKHIEKLSVLEKDELGLLKEVFASIQKIAIDEKMDKDGFRVVINDGRNGGQTVNHLHCHLLGGRFMNRPPG